MLNLESRTDTVAGQHLSTATTTAPTCTARRRRLVLRRTRAIRRSALDRHAPRRTTGCVAQVHNDAAGWDDPAYVAAGRQRAGRPCADQGQLHQERAAAVARLRAAGRAGPHRRLQRLHGLLPRVPEPRLLPQGADRLRPAHRRLHGHPAGGDGRRCSRAARRCRPSRNDAQAAGRRGASGGAGGARSAQLSAAALDGWDAQLPDDVGPAAVLGAAGAGPAVRRGDARLARRRQRRRQPDGTGGAPGRTARGSPYADQTGEIVTSSTSRRAASTSPASAPARQEWVWVATFEAFDAFPRHDVPAARCPSGTYRFSWTGGSTPAGRRSPTRWRPSRSWCAVGGDHRRGPAAGARRCGVVPGRPGPLPAAATPRRCALIDAGTGAGRSADVHVPAVGDGPATVDRAHGDGAARRVVRCAASRRALRAGRWYAADRARRRGAGVRRPGRGARHLR